VIGIGKLGAGRAEYYLSQVADGVEDYYTTSGEAPGVWLGGGSVGLGLTGELDADDLRSVLNGMAPDGTQLAGAGRKTPGFDVTMRAPKSVSLLFALGDAEIAAQVRDAHDEAVRQTLGYLERIACFTRRGHGGASVIPAEGFVAAAFRHRTSRAGDPQLHTHVLVANAVQGTDGRWTALDGRFLYAHTKPASYLYQAALRDELTRRLGVAWTPVRHGMADIEGIDRRVITAFSRRRREIVATLQERGERSARAAQVATLDTRPSKSSDTRCFADLRRAWLGQARNLGLTPARLGRLTERTRWEAVATPTISREELVSPLGLTADRPNFDRRDVIATYCNALPVGASVADVEALADRLLGHADVLPLAANALDARLQRFHRGDGRVMPSPTGQRFTTIEMAAVEKGLVDSAVARASDGVAVAPTEAVDAAIAMNTHLSEEQEAMVRRLTTSGAGVEVVVGKAGAGKTMALDVARLAWQATGTTVVGCALAARAAAELRSTAGIPAATITRLARELRSTSLPKGSVIVVDEAAMVGTRTLAWLAALAAQRELKLVFVGDDRQLPAIAAGGGFRALADQLPIVELRSNRRQTASWERSTLDDVAAGRSATAIAAYCANGRLTLAPTADATRTALVTDWATAARSGANARMIALHRSDVSDLNERARAALAALGALAGPELVLGGRRFAIGDWVIGRRNDYRSGMLNGTLGTIVAVHHAGGTVSIATLGGEQLTLPRSYLARGHLDHGYAITAHKSQGATFDQAFVLGDDRLYREAGYVALSRGRTNRLYAVDAAISPDDEHGTHEQPVAMTNLAAALARSRAEAPVAARVLTPSSDFGAEV